MQPSTKDSAVKPIYPDIFSRLAPDNLFREDQSDENYNLCG
jgi:hypothetical protein